MKIGWTALMMVCACLLAFGQKAPSAQEAMSKLAAKSKSINSMAWKWEYQKRDGDKMGSKEVYELEFLKPNYRRMTIIQRDFFSNGAVLIYNSDEDSKVNARKGIIKRSYETGDSEIDGFFRSDLPTVVKELQEWFKGAKADPVKSEMQSGKATWLVSYKPVSGKPYTQVKVWLDAKDWMPRRIELYDAKGLYSLRLYISYNVKSFTKDHFKF